MLDEISEIKNSAPFIWHKTLDNAAELEKAQRNLHETIEILREKRTQLIKHWSEIMRFADDCEAIEIPAEPLDIFAETNCDWAEIIY